MCTRMPAPAKRSVRRRIAPWAHPSVASEASMRCSARTATMNRSTRTATRWCQGPVTSPRAPPSAAFVPVRAKPRSRRRGTGASVPWMAAGRTHALPGQVTSFHCQIAPNRENGMPACRKSHHDAFHFAEARPQVTYFRTETARPRADTPEDLTPLRAGKGPATAPRRPRIDIVIVGHSFIIVDVMCHPRVGVPKR